MATGWKKLNRGDLKVFDDDQAKLVMYAMEKGGQGRISAEGHAIIRNRAGLTMSVARKGNGRRHANAAADLVRLFGPIEEAPKDKVKEQPDVQTIVPKGGDEIFHCPGTGCKETFVTEGARYSHIAKAHPFKCEECPRVFDSEQGRKLHVTRTHRGRNWGGPHRRSLELKVIEHPEPAPTPDEPLQLPELTADLQLEMIRDILGVDPRVLELNRRNAELFEELEAVKAERDELKAKLELIQEAFKA
jgi:hypothetical protein